MPQFHVDLYPVMVIRIEEIEANDAEDAIAKAIAIAEAKYHEALGDCRQRPVFSEECARYVVDLTADGNPTSATYLDSDHLAADDKNRADGLPVYQRK